MSRWIDAEYCEDFFDRWESRVKNAEPVTIDVVQNTRTLLRDAPSIDLADYVPREFHDKTCEEMARRHQAEIAELTSDRPQGEWKSKHNGYWTCSECGLSFLFYAKGNFCPNCGADMRKGADDE